MPCDTLTAGRGRAKPNSMLCASPSWYSPDQNQLDGLIQALQEVWLSIPC